MIDGIQQGPFTLEELPGAGVRPSTYIWCKGMPDWQKAEENPDVCRLFRNHLYDLMHPGVESQPSGGDAADNKWKIQPDKPSGPYPSRYDRILEQNGEDPLPTLDEIEAKKDIGRPPVSMVGYAWLSLFFCWPTGIVALVFAYKSRRAWNKGDNALSHEYCRKAQMWTGITFCLGLIICGLFLALP